MKSLKTILLILSLTLSVQASYGQRVRLFETFKDSVPYRIPALAVCRDGSLIAVSDYRYCGNDIGYGAVDLHQRISHDGGKTWGLETLLARGTAEGNSNTFGYAYGDATIVADRQSDKVLMLCVSGKMVYFNSRRDNPNRVARFRSHDGGRTWQPAEEITDQIYGLFDQRKEGPVQGLFFGSGKICQSRKVKVGRYYRLYAAV
ncbi:MAG: exo-alpha-sialidase, partial [Prevotella sp.]|nr:exo-alpha-sialidase [Prevotella sp.]